MCSSKIIGATAAAGGGALQFMGAYYQGKVANELYEYKHKLAKKSIKDIGQKGEEAVRRKRQEVSGLVGKQRAAFGASGIDVNTGMALETQVETGKMGEMDAMLIRENYREQQWAKSAEAQIYKKQAETADRLALLGGAQGLLSGASDVSSVYASYQTTKTPETTQTYEQRKTAMYDDYYKTRKNYKYGR